MALPAIGDGEQIGDGNTNEVLYVGRTGQALYLGATAATLVAFHGATGVAQAVICSAPVTGVTAGAASTADYATLVNAVLAIRTLLINKGLMAAT